MIIEFVTLPRSNGASYDVPVVEAWRELSPAGKPTNVLGCECPYCGRWHRHSGDGRRGDGDGHRHSHCDGVVHTELWSWRRDPTGSVVDYENTGYILREVGTIRRDLYQRFPTRTPVPPKLRARVMERDHFRCRRCGGDPSDSRLVVDHIVPVARGGRTVEENLQTLCELCNQGKRDSAPTEHDQRPFDGMHS